MYCLIKTLINVNLIQKCSQMTSQTNVWIDILVKKLQITHLHVFPYSAKAGTPASKMPQVALEERRKRAKRTQKRNKKRERPKPLLDNLK